MDSIRFSFEFNPYPDPLFSAADVVQLQLDAFQNNDLLAGNLGLSIAYRFASPKNRARVSSVRNYIRTVKTPLYSPLIGFEVAQLGTLHEMDGGSRAWMHVRVFHGGRTRGSFRWVLSRQTQGRYAACWLVDAVIRTL